MAKKDMTEKTLEALNDVFADIVNGLLFKGEQVLREDDLTDAQPFSMYKADGKLHEQERDVAKYWIDQSGERIRVRIAFLGIENQTKYDKDMPLRVMGYDGAAYRSELGQSERYPVVTLVLYFGEKRWGENRSIHTAVPIPERFKPYVSDHRINLYEISYLPEEAIGYFRSDFRVVADYFVKKRTDPDYRPTDPVKFRHVDELLKLMSVLTEDERFVELLDEEGGKPQNMCEVLDRAEARGEARGVARGVAIGEARGKAAGQAEGMAKGRAEGFLEALASLVKKGLLSPEDAAAEAHMTLEDFRARIAEPTAKN